MQFSDNYPPQSISIQRWPEEYATGDQNIEVAVNRSEFISVTDNIFTISDDGKNYIYEVYATWTNGNSHYSFQTVSGSTSMRPHYFAKAQIETMPLENILEDDEFSNSTTNDPEEIILLQEPAFSPNREIL